MTEEKVLTKEIAEQFLKISYSVNLSEYGSIEDTAAEILANYQLTPSPHVRGPAEHPILELNGLKNLTDAAAESLSDFDGSLELNGLIQLSDTDAKRLSKHRGELSLKGLIELTDASAESLRKHHDSLDLSGLKKLSDVAADSLSHQIGYLSLNGLTDLSDAAAQSFAKHNGPVNIPYKLQDKLKIYETEEKVLTKKLVDHVSSLRDLPTNLYTRIEDAAAESLAKRVGYLSLDGLTELSDNAAESLSKQSNPERLFRILLSLNGLTKLSDAAALSLSKHHGYLHLDGLTDLSDAAAESLSKHHGEILTLRGLTKLSDSAAESLAKYNGVHLNLSGLSELTDAVAKSLAGVKGGLGLGSYTLHSNIRNKIKTYVSEEKVLTKEIANTGFLNALDTSIYVSIDDGAAENLGDHWFSLGYHLDLSGLRELSADAAKGLVKWEQSIKLNGLRELTDTSAKKLQAL